MTCDLYDVLQLRIRQVQGVLNLASRDQETVTDQVHYALWACCDLLDEALALVDQLWQQRQQLHSETALSGT